MKPRRLLLILSSLALLASCGGSGGTPSASSEGSSLTPSASSEATSTPASSDPNSVDPSSNPSSEDPSFESNSEQSTDPSSEGASSEPASEGSSEESNSSGEEGSSQEEPVEYKRLYVHDPKGLLLQVLMDVDGGVIDLTDGAQEDEGAKYFNVVLGAKMTLTFSTTNVYVVGGAKLNGEDVAVKDGVVTFDLILDDFDDFFSLTLTYVATGVVDEGDMKLVASDSDHLKLRFYRADKATEIASAFYSEAIFVKVEGLSERYSVRELTVTYYYGDLGNKDSKTLTVDEDGYAAYTAPYEGRGVSDAGITFAVAELDKEAYAESEAVGEYAVVSLGSAASKLTSLFDKTLTVEGDGHMKFGSNETYAKSMDDGVISTVDYSTIPFGDGFLLANWGNSTIGSPFLHTYDLLCFKMEKDALLEDYSVNGERMKIDGKDYIVASFYYQGALVSSAYVRWSDKEYFFDVGFFFNMGESITDDEAFYEIGKGTTLIDTITFQGTGGLSARRLASAPTGVYVNGKDTLIVPNAEKALLNDVPYIVTYDAANNQLTLVNATEKIVVALDGTAFTVLSREDMTSSVPDFRGLTFSGPNKDCWGDDTTASIVFDQYDADEDISGTIWPDGNYSWSHPFGFTATYNADTHTLSMTIVSEKYNEGVIGKVVRATAADGRLTALDDISSIYPLKNAVLTCPSFVL